MSTEMTKRESTEMEATSERPTIRPAVDIYENTDEYLMIADMPAVAKEDLNIHLSDSQLTIEARVGSEAGDNAVQREFRLADYRRSFELPEFVDRGKVAAELDSGVLTLHLPKLDQVKPRQIEVKAG
jgi:HSP20 family protein